MTKKNPLGIQLGQRDKFMLKGLNTSADPGLLPSNIQY